MGSMLKAANEAFDEAGRGATAARARPRRKVDGWIVLDKPLGIGSTQALGRVRWLTGAAKAGHGGTLDPLATGVLPLAFGEATKTLPFIVDGAKQYRFTIAFGSRTTTDDREGQVVAASAVRPEDGAIAAALGGFLGTVMQRPPAYSAIKLGGERAYALARAGETVELAERPVEIHALRLVDRPDRDHAVIEVDCGKGTYVRSLARDLSAALGTEGHVAELRRLRAGPFGIDAAVTVEEVERLAAPWSPAPQGVLLDVEAGIGALPAIEVTAAQAQALRRGQTIEDPSGAGGGEATVRLRHAGRLVAFARGQDGLLKPTRVFNLA